MAHSRSQSQRRALFALQDTIAHQVQLTPTNLCLASMVSVLKFLVPQASLQLLERHSVQSAQPESTAHRPLQVMVLRLRVLGDISLRLGPPTPRLVLQTVLCAPMARHAVAA
jgi:hypothetical protein